jgi:hypothetical protein
MQSTSPDGGGQPLEVYGSCLCGEIEFELRVSQQYGPGRAMGVCHCSHCQRWSGGSGLPFVVAQPERFRVTRGQELIAHYRDDSTVRAFCRRCGSSLYQDVGSTYYVGAGGLRDLDLMPGFHIYVADKAPWDQIAGDAPQFGETPAARRDARVVPLDSRRRGC